MKNIFIYTFIVLTSLLSSCDEEYYLYNDVARLQFGPEIHRIYNPSANLADTLKSATFFYYSPEINKDTVFFDIYAIGGVKNVDREFVLEQVPLVDVDNAVAGVHYINFNDASVKPLYKIKAGEVHTKVPIVILRDNSLKSKTVELKIQIRENSNFKLGEVSNIWRRVIFTDRLIRPNSWDEWLTRYYLGKYSIVKHQFFIETSGQRWDDDFIQTIRANFAELGYWKSLVKGALLEYNSKNPNSPLRDEDGELVVVP